MSIKGEQTRIRIVDGALAIAKSEGLEQVTIGTLATRLQMSKSGIFAHFGSKEELQRTVLEEAEARFIAHVFRPAIASARGVARLRKLFELWIEWSSADHTACPGNIDNTVRGGCVLIGASAEFDDKPGAIREQLSNQMQRLREGLVRTIDGCKASGEFRADVDSALMAFQLFGLVLAVHHDVRLLDRSNAFTQVTQAFNALLCAAQNPAAPPPLAKQ